MNNKKQLLLSIGLVLILVLMIVGISYAAFKFTGLGTKPNTITTGAITMEYTESTNTISMTGALPTTDATGKVRLTEGEYFDFTIKSNIQGNANINWEIAAEDVTPSSAKKMDGKNIKLYLTKLNGDNEEEVMAPKVYTTESTENTYTGRPANMMSLAKGTMSASETTNYRLRMYVDESYNPQGDGGDLSFSIKINAYGKTGKKMPVGSKMKAYMTQDDLNNYPRPSTDFHTDAYMSKITSIITKKDNIVPATATESWDISEAGDGSVMAYVEDDGTGNSTYKVTIGGKGGIIANESMISYFEEFSNVTSIDLSALDTSNVTNMSAMFSYCSSLTSLDVSKFDTSQVTDMSSMFGGCSSLTSLDVSKFNTSEVTNMNSMFSFCDSLTSLDVSSFDTSQVTDMNSMFCNCPSWDVVDKTKFAGANVCHLS
jgi:surface protein